MHVITVVDAQTLSVDTLVIQMKLNVSSTECVSVLVELPHVPASSGRAAEYTSP